MGWAQSFFAFPAGVDALDDRVVQEGAELADHDVVGGGPDPVAQEDDGELPFRVDPDAGSGEPEMAP